MSGGHTHDNPNQLTIGCDACIDRRGPIRPQGSAEVAVKVPPPVYPPIILGGRWRLFSGGEAHVYDVHDVRRGTVTFRANTLCDKARVLLTHVHGTKAAPCGECYRRGVRTGEVAS